MNLKPIEPGCLAVIIESVAGNTGKVVTPLRRIPDPVGFEQGGDYWELDQPLSCVWVYDDGHTEEIEGHPFCRAAHMMRIDGHTEDEHDKMEELAE